MTAKRSKFSTPVREDEHGIYVVTNGTKYRPGGITGYDHAYEMGDAGLAKGDRVWARHKAQTPLALVTAPPKGLLGERTVIWGNDYMHERYVRAPKPTPGEPLPLLPIRVVDVVDARDFGPTDEVNRYGRKP